jgi:hypothetical protein
MNHCLTGGRAAFAGDEAPGGDLPEGLPGECDWGLKAKAINGEIREKEATDETRMMNKNSGVRSQESEGAKNETPLTTDGHE